MLKRKKGQGFSLIELLIVVAIIGIIAAIAIPNLMSALQKGRQKRTMGDMKSLGTAIESINAECGAYPAGDNSGPLGADCKTPGTLVQNLSKAGALQNPIICDGWRRPMDYKSPATGDPGTVTTVGDPNCTNVFGTAWKMTASLLSLGRDGATDCNHAQWNATNNIYEVGGTPCAGAVTCQGFGNVACDIAFAGGQFVAFPEGFQK
ncbi:MAG: prepilin-type N-terminal cleavage/methylation domain-containing protein [Acidobacteria bacterium]|nr:prepilin-type N-terminal cleavage/methylation domain-containing protein [Acidobacteriota bacterium]MDW7984293.1 prepilin-type N-terminal cleavage/methylation domain-containing protein [Acidobacteriota bacterium]